VGRADELLAIAPRTAADLLPYDGMALTDEHRAGLTIEERFVPAGNGDPDVRVLIYRPKRHIGILPAIVSIHGGAFVMLRADSFAGADAEWALRFPCVVVSVDYRLAPESPFPAGPEDCYAALCWTVEHADELGIDPARLAVTGGSAGGALSAAVTLMARDRGGPPIAFQALRIPVLDDRLATPSMRDGFGAPGFSSERAEGMWLHYLGEEADRSITSPYAAPARAVDVSGLPPAIILTNGLDPLRDEGIEYALRLLAAGVSVELYNAPGCFHGAPPVDDAAVAAARRSDDLCTTALRTALGC
jgi:acetyl esterase